jgi:polyphenol oxidase
VLTSYPECIVIRIENGVTYYRFVQWPTLTHGIFTRLGGVSQGPFDSLNLGGTVGDDLDAVSHNHDLVYGALGVDRDKTVTVWLVHSADTVIANGPVPGRRWLALADAMITDKPGVPLVMRYADCTPVMAHDPVKGVIGIAHAGWQGTVNGMAYNMIRAMIQAYDCRPSDIQAAVGPAIGPDRYQVGEEVVEAVQKHFGTLNGTGPDSTPLIRPDPADGSAYLNLWEANRRDLQRAGVEQIEIAGICTATRTDEFYSHRAERGRTGRFGAVICM